MLWLSCWWCANHIIVINKRLWTCFRARWIPGDIDTLVHTCWIWGAVVFSDYFTICGIRSGHCHLRNTSSTWNTHVVCCNHTSVRHCTGVFAQVGLLHWRFTFWTGYYCTLVFLPSRCLRLRRHSSKSWEMMGLWGVRGVLATISCANCFSSQAKALR